MLGRLNGSTVVSSDSGFGLRRDQAHFFIHHLSRGLLAHPAVDADRLRKVDHLGIREVDVGSGGMDEANGARRAVPACPGVQLHHLAVVLLDKVGEEDPRLHLRGVCCA